MGGPCAGSSSTSRLFASDETHSDASGGFELQVLLEDAASVTGVCAIASGWCRARRSFDLTADANVPVTRLYLPRATWVEGRVLDEAGGPVAGAEVTVELEWRDIEIERDWSEELRARGVELDGVSGGVSTDRGDRPVHSAADGSFRTTEQVPWRRDVVVSASLEGGRAASALLARLGAPGEPTRVELTLGRHEGAAFVHGRLSLNGEPVTRGAVR